MYMVRIGSKESCYRLCMCGCTYVHKNIEMHCAAITNLGTWLMVTKLSCPCCKLLKQALTYIPTRDTHIQADGDSYK